MTSYEQWVMELELPLLPTQDNWIWGDLSSDSEKHLILLTFMADMPFFSKVVAFELVIVKPIGSPTLVVDVEVPS